jgi:hypothetical protein
VCFRTENELHPNLVCSNKIGEENPYKIQNMKNAKIADLNEVSFSFVFGGPAASNG